MHKTMRNLALRFFRRYKISPKRKQKKPVEDTVNIKQIRMKNRKKNLFFDFMYKEFHQKAAKNKPQIDASTNRDVNRNFPPTDCHRVFKSYETLLKKNASGNHPPKLSTTYFQRPMKEINITEYSIVFLEKFGFKYCLCFISETKPPMFNSRYTH